MAIYNLHYGSTNSKDIKKAIQKAKSDLAEAQAWQAVSPSKIKAIKDAIAKAETDFKETKAAGW